MAEVQSSEPSPRDAHWKGGKEREREKERTADKRRRGRKMRKKEMRIAQSDFDGGGELVRRMRDTCAGEKGE